MKIKVRWWYFLILIIAAAASYSAYRWWNRDVVAVKTAVVARGLIEEIISASGNVKAPVYELDSKLGGKIAALYATEGDRVGKGQVLAELDNTARLVSPAGGLVAKINYQVGESVPPGFPAIVMVNYNQSWVEAQVDEVDIANVRVGEKASITSDVFPGKVYEGEVAWITPLAELRKVGGRIKMDEESYVFLCKIDLRGKHDELKINMQVNADILAKKNPAALIVPREAISSRDDSSYVFVIRNNRAYEKKIGIGIRSYTSLEAVSGAVEGEMIAISNVGKLKDKGRIKIEK